ncbi:PP2C family protein-serine/threonine phosphatase [Streptomyces sp. NPDC048301]|uniref:PP2C family protein-serine/threonine phosphatase n=1 Tax=unclassified Streptomyces TaxID=2593676 RepID=UPI003426177E
MRRPHILTGSRPDLLGAAAVLVIALADTLLQEERLLVLFAVGPALAAPRTDARGVVGTGLFATVLQIPLAHAEGELFTRGEFSALSAIALSTVFSASAARARILREHRLSRLHDVARTAQEAIIEAAPETAGPARISASYESASDAARIGGDFYDVVPVRGGVRVLIGDVQGKGLDAVRPAAVVLAAFRESAPVAQDLDGVASKLSCALARRTEGERFVTAVLAELGTDGTTTLLNHGHPAPLVVRADGAAERAEPDEPGVPLGLGVSADGRPGRCHRILSDGDRVLFHTDGLAEARDAEGRFYPLDARSGLLRGDTVASSMKRLREDARRHVEPAAPDDDSALLLLEYTDEPHRLSSSEPRRDGAPEHPDCEVCFVHDCSVRQSSGSRGEPVGARTG